MLSGAMLLDHLGESDAAGRVRRGIEDVLSDGRVLTPDLGGESGTNEMTRAICGAIANA
jgi:isocitrate/isopropylmalate dehydrogenase